MVGEDKPDGRRHSQEHTVQNILIRLQKLAEEHVANDKLEDIIKSDMPEREKYN